MLPASEPPMGPSVPVSMSEPLRRAAGSPETDRIMSRLRQEADRVESDLHAQAEKSQRVLEQGEESFRTFVHQSPDGIVIIDSAGRIVEWNDGEELITGIARSEAMFQPLWDVQHRLAPAGKRTDTFLSVAREKILEGLKAGPGLRRVLEDEIQRPDGDSRVVQSVVLAFQVGGKVMAGGISRDITARRRAEEALVEANLRLAEADRRKNEFLAMLAHELRDPLAVISSAIQVLRARGSGDPTAHRALQALERPAGHMARLVEDLLDVSRVGQGKMVLRKEIVALSSVVEGAIDAARPLIDAKDHRLSVSLPGAALFLHADHVRLTQVLTNVLNNAAKFTPAGGEIRLSAERENDRAVIRVRDSGHGIEADLLPHVFDPFVQADHSPDQSRGGLGLGLTIVRSLVELHGGRVEAYSRGPGRGSEFAIWLPVAPSSDVPAALESTKPETRSARRILVIDDNAAAAEMLGVLLELDGHEVGIAHSGHAAIELARTRPPDLALLDIEMPDMDGLELARRLRQDPLLATAVLVAVTGRSQDEDLQESRAAGFDHHLVKPVDMDVLRRLIANTIPRAKDAA